MNVALVSIVRRHKEKQRALGKNVRQKYHGFGANIARFVNQTRSKTFSPSFVLFRNRRTNYKLIVGSFYEWTNGSLCDNRENINGATSFYFIFIFWSSVKFRLAVSFFNLVIWQIQRVLLFHGPERKYILYRLFLSVFTRCHGNHISVSNQSRGSWTIADGPFFCSNLLEWLMAMWVKARYFKSYVPISPLLMARLLDSF